MTQRVIIVGGTGGIGAALARKLSQNGASLHLVGRDATKLSALSKELDASFAVADVRDEASLRTAITAAGENASGLCYAVGSINLKPVARLTVAEIEGDFRLNALGAFTAIQAALPLLKAHEQSTSSVLLFSTVAVAQGFGAHASVALAKGAVEGLTLALAAELAPKIRVNCVAPSLTRTPLAAALTGNEQMVKAIAALHPLQRIGEPEDVAALAAFLLSPQADWITGQIIGVDGGRSSLRTKG
jgi:NAD(P)-dependent dehydrogenase (short-subunit alcohol dehydrogenase family)